MSISRKFLVLLAGLFWTVAGFNVAHIGLHTWSASGGNLWLKLLCMGFTFAFFAGFIFRRMYQRNSTRFLTLTGKSHLLQIFDKRGWLIMGIMISLGICLRTFSLVPLFFIAFFYTGLGLALFLTGLRFGYFLYRNRRIL